LNTRVAIAEMQSVVKILRQANSSQDSLMASACVGWLSAYAGDVLGLLPDEETLQRMVGRVSERRDEIRDKVESLIMMREDARAERNWEEADRIRDEISELGVVIEDGDSGATWRMKEF
ncbi:MAG: cysteine--tRNA ligase, partial [Candidatus Thermoplasmatota archaeon]|nr:cysteine--tRNA ligase [Candidatus Thermoplasmatota archaeon]